jgi:hypothetical protein
MALCSVMTGGTRADGAVNMAALAKLAAVRLPLGATVVQQVARLVASRAAAPPPAGPLEAAAHSAVLFLCNLAVCGPRSACDAALRTPGLLEALATCARGRGSEPWLAQAAVAALQNLVANPQLGDFDTAAVAVVADHPGMLQALAKRLDDASRETPGALDDTMRQVTFRAGHDPYDPSSQMMYAAPQPLMLLISLVDNGRAATVARARCALDAASRCLRRGSPLFKTGAAELIGRLCANREAAAEVLLLRPVTLSDDVLAAAEQLAPSQPLRAAITVFRFDMKHPPPPGTGAVVQEGQHTNLRETGTAAAGAAEANKADAAHRGAPSRRGGPKRCAKCGKTAAEAGSARLKLCSRCNAVFYCSSACQVRAVGSRRKWAPARLNMCAGSRADGLQQQIWRLRCTGTSRLVRVDRLWQHLSCD